MREALPLKGERGACAGDPLYLRFLEKLAMPKHKAYKL